VCVYARGPGKLQQSSIKTFNGIDHSLACAKNIHLCSVLLMKLKKVLMKSHKYLIPPRCFIPSLRSMGGLFSLACFMFAQADAGKTISGALKRDINVK
jgi:hypothetical protein